MPLQNIDKTYTTITKTKGNFKISARRISSNRPVSVSRSSITNYVYRCVYSKGNGPLHTFRFGSQFLWLNFQPSDSKTVNMLLYRRLCTVFFDTKTPFHKSFSDLFVFLPLNFRLLCSSVQWGYFFNRFSNILMLMDFCFPMILLTKVFVLADM